MNIVVLGSGGWGTAAAMLLSDNSHTVTLWSHDPKKAELLNKTRENSLLKGVLIPERIAITSDLNVLGHAEMIVFASPSFALRSVAHGAAASRCCRVPHTPRRSRAVCRRAAWRPLPIRSARRPCSALL